MDTYPRTTATYSNSGVDITKGDAFVDHLKTLNPLIGGFSGLFELPPNLKNPRLVASTDGVGTKLLLAQLMNEHHTIGIDLVAMVVNDLIVCGAKPLFFLDYFATGKLDVDAAKTVMSGIVEGCKQSGCPLIGGETAEMPGMYAPGHYDLAGFGVGIVEAEKVVDGSCVQSGDAVIGLMSNGLHSNGFSLARNVLLPQSMDVNEHKKILSEPFTDGQTLGNALLKPTRIYVKPILELLQHYPISAAAHITGGGIAGNLVRVLPKGVCVSIHADRWKQPKIFKTIAQNGPVSEEEMYRVFNMGIGFILIVSQAIASDVMAHINKLGEACALIGTVNKTPQPDDMPQVEIISRDGNTKYTS